MKIPSETIELIRSRLDIVELVGETVPLTRAGRNLKARCPFHQEKSPSFIVSPERQTFHCFGCGEGGDAFSFVMKSEGLGFMEAAEKLAQRAGVKLEADRELGPQEKERLKMREANEFAAAHYHELLKKDPSAEAARAYVMKRRLSKSSVEGFLLGFAPRNGTLVAAAAKKGFPAELLLKCGLAAKRPDGSLRDYFFDRLMFPIRDAKGGFVGFGGRILGDGEPKYLNSPESPVFNKSRVLYGLYEGLAETRKARTAQLMEGYMDVIATHQHGLKTACAGLGTALTPEHAALLKRYADKVQIVFDADNAGQNAAVKGAEIALEAGFSVRVASVPEGKDPDEYLHAKGLDGFKAALEQAQDLVAFKTELLVKRAGNLTPEAKSAIAKDVLATIARCPDEVLKDEWVRRLAARIGVNEDSLRRAGGKAVPQNIRRVETPAQSRAPESPRRPVPPLGTADSALLKVLLQAPAVLSEANEQDFAPGTARELFAALRGVEPRDAGWRSRALDALRETPLFAALSALLADDAPPHADPVAAARDKLKRHRQYSTNIKDSVAAAATKEQQDEMLMRLTALKKEKN